MSDECANCGEPRNLVRVRASQPLCSKCSGVERRKPLPTCKTCGKSKKSYAPQCADCYNDSRYRAERQLVEVFCESCGETRMLKAAQLKYTDCQSCKAKARADRGDMACNGAPRVRHYRVCECGVTKQVSSSKKAGIVSVCPSCKPKPVKVVKAKRAKPTANPPKKPKGPSPREIERARLRNIRHVEKMEREAAKQDIIPPQKMSDSEFIAKYLKDKK